MVKIAVLTPTPRMSGSVASTAKRRWRESIRTDQRRSLPTRRRPSTGTLSMSSTPGGCRHPNTFYRHSPATGGYASRRDATAVDAFGVHLSEALLSFERREIPVRETGAFERLDGSPGFVPIVDHRNDSVLRFRSACPLWFVVMWPPSGQPRMPV